MKDVEFRGTSLDDLRAFPAEARREAGYQIDQVQQGRDPDNWKRVATVGSGVREIRIREGNGVFRIIYIAKLADRILYCIVCRRRRRRLHKAISTWPSAATGDGEGTKSWISSGLPVIGMRSKIHPVKRKT